jgi:hypothetical protein
MDIKFPNHILNNIKNCLLGGCIRHQILLLSYAISEGPMLCYIIVIIVS